MFSSGSNPRKIETNELSSLFESMIGKYPPSTGELKRQDSPTFYHKDNVSVAIKQTGGCSNIPIQISLLSEIIDKLDVYDTFGGFLIFCDTDLKNKEAIKEDFSKKFQSEGILFKNNQLEIYGNPVPCKLYLFPTSGVGAIEKLLLECSYISYNNLCQDAKEYRDKIMTDDYQELRKDCWAKKDSIQEFYSDKVQFGAISTVLKPDKPVRFAIKDKLIKKKYFDKYMALPEFKKLHNFLQNNLV